MKDSDRRYYLHSLLAGAVAMVDELRGKPHFKLDELDTLPDVVLGNMVPVVHQGKNIRIEDGWLLAQEEAEAAFNRCLRLDAQEEYIVSHFDGQHSVIGICKLMETEYGLSHESALAAVRRLFVTLAQQGIYHPAGRPE